MKTKIRRSGLPLEFDESKMCPFAELYDADLHDFLSNLRRVDGSLPVHPLYGPPVNLSLLQIPANTGHARQLLSWGIFCSWSLIRWYGY